MVKNDTLFILGGIGLAAFLLLRNRSGGTVGGDVLGGAGSIAQGLGDTAQGVGELVQGVGGLVGGVGQAAGAVGAAGGQAASSVGEVFTQASKGVKRLNFTPFFRAPKRSVLGPRAASFRLNFTPFYKVDRGRGPNIISGFKKTFLPSASVAKARRKRFFGFFSRFRRGR